MKKHALLVVAAAVMFTVGASAVFAQSGPAARGGPSEMMKGPMDQFGGPLLRSGLLLESLVLMKWLAITDEQMKEFRALSTAFREHTRKTRMDLMSLREEKLTMLRSGEVDKKKLAEIDDKIVNLRTDLMKERLKLRRDRLGLLTRERIQPDIAARSFRRALDSEEALF